MGRSNVGTSLERRKETVSVQSGVALAPRKYPTSSVHSVYENGHAEKRWSLVKPHGDGVPSSGSMSTWQRKLVVNRHRHDAIENSQLQLQRQLHLPVVEQSGFDLSSPEARVCEKAPYQTQGIYSGRLLQSTNAKTDAPRIVDLGQDDATMVESEANLEKEGLSSEWMQPRGCNYVDAEPRGCNPMDGTRGCISLDVTPMKGTNWKQQSIDLEDIMELDTHEHFGRAGRSTCTF
ncbi:hypothetical protein Bca101_081910 [Brassica carinata]